MIRALLRVFIFASGLYLMASGAPGQSVNVGVTSVLTADVDCCNQGLILAQQVQVGQAGLLQSISYYTITAAGAQLILGLYDASGLNGGPGNLLASTNAFAAGDNSWNTTNVITPVMLVPGVYWLSYEVTSNDTRFPVDRTTGLTDVGYAPFGPLPGIFPVLTDLGELSEWSFYATLNVNPMPSPSPTATPLPTPTPTPLPTPSPTPGQVTLDWNPPSAIASYILEYGTTQGGPYPNTANVGLVYTDTLSGLISGQTYYARVYSLDANGNPSCPTAEISFVAP